MTDEQKHEADTLQGLLERSWSQFNERRRYELRLSFAVWTALALSIAGSAKLESLPDIPFGRFTLLGVVFFVLVLHYKWQVGIRRANHRDHLRIGEYQRQIHKLAGDFAYQDPDTIAKLEAGKTEAESRWHWSNTTQVGFTMFLGLCLAMVNWNGFAPGSASSRASPIVLARDSLALETDRVKLFLLRQDSVARVKAPASRTTPP
jgi:hypothetical protein